MTRRPQFRCKKPSSSCPRASPITGSTACSPATRPRKSASRKIASTAQRLKRAARQDLTLGFDRYQSKLNRLSQRTPAYNRTQTALIALKEGDLDQGAIGHPSRACANPDLRRRSTVPRVRLPWPDKHFAKLSSTFQRRLRSIPATSDTFWAEAWRPRRLKQTDAAGADLRQSQALYFQVRPLPRPWLNSAGNQYIITEPSLQGLGLLY